MNYKKIIPNKKLRLIILNSLRFIPDKIMIKIQYRIKVGKFLNLENPRYFTEKLQWLKLYNRKVEYTKMVDKYEAKKFIESKIGKKYIVPTIGCWKSFDDIDFEKLPNEFVLKCTHDSGSVIFCDNKQSFDYNAAKKIMEFHLKNDEYILGREWPYKNVDRRIIAEPRLSEKTTNTEIGLKDYKFFCFNGEPKIMYISNDKGKDPRTDFFDMDFNHLPIKMKDPNADVCPSKPKMFEEMKNISRILSNGIPHLRVDFYVINEKIYVGELTFFHNSGYTPVLPIEWDLKMGEWITL